MDNNKRLFEGLLKADGIEPSGVSEGERAVFREMLDREKKRMKHLSWFSVGAMWIFALGMFGLCVSEKILEALHIPFVVAWFGLIVMIWAVIIRYYPRYYRKLKESNKRIRKLHFLVYAEHRGFALVGKKNGKRIIHWPSLLILTTVIWLFVSLSGAGVYYLLCQRWIFFSSPILHIFFCNVISLPFVIFLLLEGFKAPLDELVEVKAKSKKSKPETRETRDSHLLIC